MPTEDVFNFLGKPFALKLKIDNWHTKTIFLQLETRPRVQLVLEEVMHLLWLGKEQGPQAACLQAPVSEEASFYVSLVHPQS